MYGTSCAPQGSNPVEKIVRDYNLCLVHPQYIPALSQSCTVGTRLELGGRTGRWQQGLGGGEKQQGLGAGQWTPVQSSRVGRVEMIRF